MIARTNDVWVKSSNTFPSSLIYLGMPKKQFTVANCLFWSSSCASPALEVVNDRVAAAPGNDPDHILVTIIDLLVFGIGWYEGEVSGSKLLPLRTIRAADNSAMTACGVNNRIYCCASERVQDVTRKCGEGRRRRSGAYPLHRGDVLRWMSEVWQPSLLMSVSRAVKSIPRHLPVPHIWSDLSTIAGMRIMPSV
jgi:hypothetical protein